MREYRLLLLGNCNIYGTFKWYLNQDHTGRQFSIGYANRYDDLQQAFP